MKFSVVSPNVYRVYIFKRLDAHAVTFRLIAGASFVYSGGIGMGLQVFLGTFLSPDTPTTLTTGTALIVRDGIILRRCTSLDEATALVAELGHGSDITYIDGGQGFFIPGFADIHWHAPQFANLGIGLDLPLLPWLEKYTFPEEARFKDLDYANVVFARLLAALLASGTTASVIFGSLHREATEQLMSRLSQTGLRAYVGKVNMDRNAPDYYINTTENDLVDTDIWLKNTVDAYELVKPIITPRFVPTCTPELMTGLSKLANTYEVPVQSHLSENQDEIKWVAQLHPEAQNYLDVYRRLGLLRPGKTIMAHCVWSDDKERAMLAEEGVIAAHAPTSNNNLGSGLASISRLRHDGVNVGLCSDIAGGHTLFMGEVIATAAAVAKLRETLYDDEPVTLHELFYLATHGAGFFGPIGDFKPGSYADLLLIDDEPLQAVDPQQRTPEERLQRFIYSGGPQHIKATFVKGQRIQHH